MSPGTVTDTLASVLQCNYQVPVRHLADHIQVILFRYITFYLAIQNQIDLFCVFLLEATSDTYEGTFIMMIMYCCQSVFPS